MASAVLLFLSCILSIGVGKQYTRLDALQDLKDEAENSVKVALLFKNKNSEIALGHIHFLKEFDSMRIFSPGTCQDLDRPSDVFSKFSSDTKNVLLPLNLWISQINEHIDTLNIYIQAEKVVKALVGFSETNLNVYEGLPGRFFGNCYIPLPDEHPQNTLNSNDISYYQKRTENCKSGDPERYQCGSGECISFNNTCDGKFDCWDGSDELCQDSTQCGDCDGFCLLGPTGSKCLATCPKGIDNSFKVCKLNQFTCHKVCDRGIKPISSKCMVEILPNLMDSVEENTLKLINETYTNYIKTVNKIYECKNGKVEGGNIRSVTEESLKEDETLGPEIKNSGNEPSYRRMWPPTTRWTTRHTTWHPTWHTTTKHPTWHPTTKHPTWHPTTRHTTWHPTWHTTTKHPTWHPTTKHPTWHPTTRHTTWHPTTRHSTWHPTWHTTTKHPTWHPTTRHTTWHPTSKHTTWHTTTVPTTMALENSHFSIDNEDYQNANHHSTKNTTPHSTTQNTKHTTRHHTTKHTTHHTTKHTTRHTTEPTTQHTTEPTTTTITTTPTTTVVPTTTTTTTHSTSNKWQ